MLAVRIVIVVGLRRKMFFKGVIRAGSGVVVTSMRLIRLVKFEKILTVF